MARALATVGRGCVERVPVTPRRGGALPGYDRVMVCRGKGAVWRRPLVGGEADRPRMAGCRSAAGYGPVGRSGEIKTYSMEMYTLLAKLRLKPTKHDWALVKQNRYFVKPDLFAKLSGK